MALKRPRIVIKSNEVCNGAQTEIFIDGRKLHGVRRYKLEQDAFHVPVLTLDLNALDICIDMDTIMKQEGYGEIEEIKFRETE